jgi:hypothetical protein
MAERFTKSNAVVERQVRDSLILVPLKTGPARLDALYTLNETAGFIWRAADGTVSEDELVRRLMAEYDVDDATAQNDVRRALEGLVAIGALQATERET